MAEVHHFFEDKLSAEMGGLVRAPPHQHPLHSHHATQNSCPASLAGGRCSRSTGRVPPGRTMMLLNSVSG